jgi:hypothetical protein
MKSTTKRLKMRTKTIKNKNNRKKIELTSAIKKVRERERDPRRAQQALAMTTT